MLLKFVLFTIAIQYVSSSCVGDLPIGEWKDMTEIDDFPHNSVGGGNDRTVPLYICRVADNHCGKSSKMGFCWIPLNGQEVAYNKFQVLTNVKGIWAPIFNSKDKPCNALKITEQDGKDIYSGRQHHPQGTLILGEVKDSINYITYGGYAYSSEYNYEIFTAVPNKIVLNSNESKYFKVNGNYITFKVYRSGNHYLQLGETKENLRFQIDIKSGTLTFRDLENNEKKSVEYNIMFGEYESYWLYWSDNKMRFGIEGTLHARLRYDNEDVSKIKYFKISSDKESTWEMGYFDEVL